MVGHRSGRKSLFYYATILLLAILLVAPLSPASVQAQDAPRYFPETGHWLRGAFRSFWERNGGLQLFGYPLTEEYRRSDGRIVQWFERSRFELASANPLIVELGHVGVEATSGRVFPQVPPFRTNSQRRYFPETGHSLQGLFRKTWETRGGLKIFGFPISEEINEQINGQWLLVQYFERARFELRLQPSRVEFGQLARPMVPPQLTDRWPPYAIPPGPLNEDGSPRPPAAGVAVRMSAGSANYGQTLFVQGEGFEPGERVSLWMTGPDNVARGIDAVPEADRNGSISGAQVAVYIDGSFRAGTWAITAQGNSSGRLAIGRFNVGAAPQPAGDPNRLGQVLQDGLRPSGDGSAVPLAAPPEVSFSISARGFVGNEDISVWLTRPDGNVDSLSMIARSNGQGAVSVTFKVPTGQEGVWHTTAEGISSKRRVIVPFKVTRDFVAPLGTPRPANRNGAVSPAEGGRGAQFRITATGFRANEVLELWITSPDGLYVLASPVRADSKGRIGVSPTLTVQMGAQNATGVYGYHYRGTASGKRADIYFTYTGR